MNRALIYKQGVIPPQGVQEPLRGKSRPYGMALFVGK